MSSRIPPLLEPYVELPPEASLVLLTSVLGASSNWLVLRFLYSAMIGSEVSSEVDSEDEPKVLLVSFMRDLTFWKENARRLGLDLDKLALKKRFAFLDGIGGLFLPRQSSALARRGGERVITKPGLETITRDIQESIEALQGPQGTGKVLLVIDQLDLLLAAGGEELGTVQVEEMLMDLRENVHATIMTLSADQPLVSSQQTPLEANHSAILLSTAHQADVIMNLRLLDTGTARDVSGVLRVTAGDRVEEDLDIQERKEDRELLYLVGGDGGVKIFERGQ
ncbi:hypothetical protein ONS95_001762 [Cadophora gregata]|uniref:uncharacterized protein n=1 Tax=Cadophora gregata TaxID=51156 RepID=UPI0026DBB6CC|nr:uncharacterized protein ONS95_001762 [Cadophora gregata]KAK0111401.1 hypothetical protein ONS95_001762 [Cadophora gregata]KAK0112122.1 hypothetical protein ONS96_001380 [Cadophora gregata f. sp. sojae]